MIKNLKVIKIVKKSVAIVKFFLTLTFCLILGYIAITMISEDLRDEPASKGSALTGYIVLGGIFLYWLVSWKKSVELFIPSVSTKGVIQDIEKDVTTGKSHLQVNHKRFEIPKGLLTDLSVGMTVEVEHSALRKKVYSLSYIENE